MSCREQHLLWPSNTVVVSETGRVWLVLFMWRRRCFLLTKQIHFDEIEMVKHMPSLLFISLWSRAEIRYANELLVSEMATQSQNTGPFDQSEQSNSQIRDKILERTVSDTVRKQLMLQWRLWENYYYNLYFFTLDECNVNLF